MRKISNNTRQQMWFLRMERGRWAVRCDFAWSFFFLKKSKSVQLISMIYLSCSTYIVRQNKSEKYNEINR